MTTFEQMMRPSSPPTQARSLTPWLAMFIRPRRTMRQLLDGDPIRLVLPLAMLGGWLHVLDQAAIKGFGDTIPVSMIFAMSIPVGVVGGLLALYVCAAVMQWTGSWLGGYGTATEVRAALAWGRMPVYWAGLLWLPYLAFFGGEIFMTEMASVQSQPWLLFVLVNLAVLELGLGIWGLVTVVLAVAEVHRFSAWRSLVCMLMAMVMILLPLFVLAMIAGVAAVLMSWS